MEAVEHFHEHDHDHHHAQERLQAWLKAALLLGLGLYFIYNIASGNLANYVNARFGWLSYVAAALFLMLAASSAYDLLKTEKRKHDEHHHHEHDHDHDHEHGAISWPALAVVAVPLVLGTLIPSRPLGSDAVGGSISLSAVSSTTSVTGFTTNPLERSVLDWLRAFNQSGDTASFNGQSADVIGFVYKEPTFGEDYFMVARFAISCCVADASAIGLPVAWDGSQDLAADTWVRVQGAFQVGDFRGDTVPILHATSVDVVPQPEHPYLYP